ncbi:rhodanese-like domain-containing protein [Desulfobacterales bacterium HSG17]|nr:rhodanese-like domain-containing protein [Desulfobacterales bacterium HSG17]
MTLMQDKKAVFMDTRKSKEMKVSMLPGAITQDTFLNNTEKYKDHTVIAYCTISYRSGKIAEKLAEKGINIYNLTGGILAWVHEKGRIFDKNGETRRVHVYGKKWDLLPDDYESLW